MNDQQHPLRLLFAEDDDALRFTMASVLGEDMGYEVESCETGEEAIGLLRREPFDVVILDYKMPGISGLNVLQWMHEQKMETPVIMMTGAGSETIAVEVMKLGAYDYFRKDQVDICHLPVIINGVHERYLFKKEKAGRESTERYNSDTIRNFTEITESMGTIVRKSLTDISAEIEKHEKRTSTGSPAEEKKESAALCAALRQHYSVVAFAMSAILCSVSNLSKEINKQNTSPVLEHTGGVAAEIVEG